MDVITGEITRLIGGYIPQLLGAILILIVGWLIAVIVSGAVRSAVRRTGLGDRLGNWISGGQGPKPAPVHQWIGTAVYYLILVFVLIAVFQVLGLTLITDPLNRLLGQIFTYLPRLIGAMILLLIAWGVATVLRMVVVRLLVATRADERLASGETPEGQRPAPISKSVGEAVYWLVFLLFLPMILGALDLQGLLAPVQAMLDRILSFLPNLIAAAVILVVGWFVARIVQRIVGSLLAAVGTDTLSERLGIAQALGQQRVSSLIALIVYILILVPVLIASLNALGLEALTGPASNMLNQLLLALPNILAAAVLLVLSYVIARVAAGLVANLLTGLGFNTVPARLRIGREPASGERTASEVVGSLVIIAVMLFASMEAARLLGFALLAELVAMFIGLAGQVVLGLVIIALGLYLGDLAYGVVNGTTMAQRALLAQAARIAVIVLAAAMGLRQMGLANEIINLAFGLGLGAVAVAVAISFGLGGREAAARRLESWETSVRSAPAGAAAGAGQTSAVPFAGIDGIDAGLRQKLADLRITDTDELLARARTTASRRDLAAQLGLDPKAVLELANRADLSRVKGVTATYSDLLENAGVDTVKELASRVPGNLHARLEQVYAERGIAGHPPTLAEVQTWVAEAKTLPLALEY